MITPPRSAYLHIPFCHRRCFYCDFAVVPLGDKASGDNGRPGSSSINSYLELLHREIELIEQVTPLSTIYIGGGTPSLLTPAQVSHLLDHLRKKFGFQFGSEITMEIDPASFDKGDLELYLNAGINRVSLGGQSFQDETLEELGRRHRSFDLIEACKLLDEAFKERALLSWSLDLIQNLPSKNISAWEKELAMALEFSIPHISIYDISVEAGTVFAWRERRGELVLLNEDSAFEISNFTSAILNKAGYGRYEISNYALPGHASRHNRVYWSGSGWWGFGQGATSSPWGQRFSRPRTREGYQSWLEEQERNGIEESLLVTNAKPMDLDEQLIVGLRRREGIDLELLVKLWGWNQEQSDKYLNALNERMKDFWENGFLKHYGKRVALTDPCGMEISNRVFVEVILWWESLPHDAVSLSSPLEL